MKILGIETSCDETAVAIVEGKTIIAEAVASQIETHKVYGGVVPELASREHLKKLNILIEYVLETSKQKLEDIDGIAVTARPGLEGSLLVGKTAARTISVLKKIPLIEIDHLEAHLFAASFLDMPPPPGIGMVVSGGHTRLYYIKDWGDYEIVGNTRDDAVGESFDKVATVLGLPYPGGPSIEKAALEATSDTAFKFPLPKMKGSQYDFSYSGLKTAVVYKFKYEFEGRASKETIASLSYAFQEAAFRQLTGKAVRLMEERDAPWIVVAGGVAANSRLRELFYEAVGGKNKVFFPSKRLCTDNAVMVAACGSFYLQRELELKSQS